jgi:hypothetical protein
MVPFECSTPIISATGAGHRVGLLEGWEFHTHPAGYEAEVFLGQFLTEDRNILDPAALALRIVVVFHNVSLSTLMV